MKSHESNELHGLDVRRPCQSDLENRFARCAKCDYRLAGLPAVHRCPECGLVYDANAWRSSPARTRIAGRLTLCVMLTLAWLFMAQQYGPTLPRVVACGGAVSVLWGSSVLFWLRMRRAAPLVAIAPQGVLVREAGQEAELFEWSRLAGVETVRAGDRAFVALVLNRGRRVNLSACMRDDWAATEFLRRTRRMQQVHGLEAALQPRHRGGD